MGEGRGHAIPVALAFEPHVLAHGLDSSAVSWSMKSLSVSSHVAEIETLAHAAMRVKDAGIECRNACMVPMASA